MNRGIPSNALAAAVAALAVAGVLAQTRDVRRLFYDASDRPAAPKKATKGSKTQKKETVVLPAVEHLGLNYSVMLVDQNCGGGRPVDADRNFRNGEHFTLSFEPNMSGYLYIFSQGTDGNWVRLLPSERMAGEENFLTGRQRITIPKNYCFTVEPPAGVDRMIVVLARNVENVASLNAAMQAEHGGGPPPPPGQPPRQGRVEMASVLNKEVEQLRPLAYDRNIGITKAEAPADQEQPAKAAPRTKAVQTGRTAEIPHSVFVVNTSAAPVNRIVLEVKIRHE